MRRRIWLKTRFPFTFALRILFLGRSILLYLRKVSAVNWSLGRQLFGQESTMVWNEVLGSWILRMIPGGYDCCWAGVGLVWWRWWYAWSRGVIPVDSFDWGTLPTWTPKELAVLGQRVAPSSMVSQGRFAFLGSLAGNLSFCTLRIPAFYSPQIKNCKALFLIGACWRSIHT